MKKSPQQYIVNFLTSDADDIWSTIEIREEEGISATGALIAILQDTGDTASDKRAHQFKRIKAAYGLGKLRDPRSIPVLIDALREHDESLSLVASSALVAIGSEAVEPLISALLLYLDRHFRFFAIDTLKQLGDKRAVEPLIALLQDTEVSGQAAIALGSLGDPNAAISLIDAIDKHEQSSCRPFVIALGMIGEPLAIKSLVKCLIDYPDHVSLGAAEALGRIGRAAETILLEYLNHPSQDVQGKAAIALGYLGLSNGFRILIETLRESQSSYIRSGAARALGIIGDAAALDALILAIEEDAVIGVRNDAVEAIRIIGNPTQRVNDALIAILRDSDWHLVWNAVLALSRVGDQQAIPELERLFQEAPSWWNFYDQEVSGTIGNAAQYAIEQIELRNK